MRILLDARLYGAGNLGIGRYLTHLIGSLQEIDTRNKYFILLTNKYYESLRLSKNFTKVKANFGVYGISEQIKLPLIINKINPDVSHFPHFNVPLFFHGKFIVTLHDMTMHKSDVSASKLNPILFYLKKFIYKRVFKKAVYDSSKIIVPTSSVQKELIDEFGVSADKISVIYEGFDRNIWDGKHKLDILQNGEFPAKKYFVYLGSLYPHKNVRTLIEAFVKVNSNLREKVGLAIVSGGSIFEKDLINLIKSKGAEKYIRIMGYVRDRDLSSLLKNSIALVNPSLSEGFGLPGLEAISSGTLVACSDIPVFREVYGQNASYFDPGKPTEIARVVNKILNIDYSERAGKILTGKKFIAKYSWTKMARQTLGSYDSPKLGI